MKRQPHRLPAETAGPFSGNAIDRSRPLRFRLDGRVVEGFAGDTVLSAVLAAGIDTAGMKAGFPVALGRSTAPLIGPAGTGLMLPMERTPATEGADYRTGGDRRLLDRLLRRNSLGLDLIHSAPSTPATPLHTTADLVVVGAGVAGLTAALAGARAGLSVTILEARPQLGGHAVLFGRQEGEEQPEVQLKVLQSAVAASDAIRVLTHAEVLSVRSGRVRVHTVSVAKGPAEAKLLEIDARYIIIATGSIERLPIFSGNRLPRVRGSLEAFELGHRYGIWPGRSMAATTTSSPVYRLAMLAADAGVTVARVMDTRPVPESRFIAFSRAYGITQATGTQVAEVSQQRGRLSVRPEAVSGHPSYLPITDILTDSLVACAGWQPDLTLWHGAGGMSQWHPQHQRLEPMGEVAGVALAGSAAGWLSRTACVLSAVDAVAKLLGHPRKQVREPKIDPLYDTPDDPTPVASSVSGATAYLDGGRRLFVRPVPVRSRWPFVRPKPIGSFADTPQPLEIGTIAAAVQLDLIPAASAGIVAQERTGLALHPAPAAEAPPAAPAPLVPDYLAGRFEGRGVVWLVAPPDERLLEPGTLIFRDADSSDPLQAVGVIIRPVESRALALVDSTLAEAGRNLVVREGGRALPLSPVSPYGGADLAAALGGSTSPA